MKAQTFQDLMVWQKAHQFVLAVYRLSQSFPNHEVYGLTSQIRRASVSIPANIAEGFKKKTPKEKVRFFNIAQGSLEEVRYYLILTRDLNYGDTENLAHHLDEIGRMLEGYMKSILRKSD